jgi:ring-1,2-phenylacetyl-CoA epoxidase subunit PaaD
MDQLNHDIDTSAEIKKIWKLLEEVYDPEVPVLSVLDLGIVRHVTFHHPDESVTVTITPTYSGCPAMDMISMNIKMMLLSNGYKNVNVIQTLTPAWTTDWMTEKGKEKLKEYGIAPPNVKQQVCNQELFVADEAVQCPHCHSWHTQRISEFGSTACKALYQCADCKEPFDYFKCH